MLNITTKLNLKKKNLHILSIILILVITSCSTKKNTWSTRAYQEINTRYNVFFNGKVSYENGLKNILRANVEDYSTIIAMYPISNHKNASAATSDMDRTIEKCRKAIKLHSIKIKPKKNYKKANQPDYKLFYSQEEFNPALKEVWLQLGQAEFHKGDFLGAVGTFMYISRHYAADKNMIAKCQLWTASAYAELGWIYEAEQVLSKLEQANLKHSSLGLFSSVNADLLLKKHQYKEAIPFLELAISKEKDKDLKLRFSYLLAQLYKQTNQNSAAYDAFTKVIKMNPPYEMDFYAKINRTQLGLGNVTKVRSELAKMLKNTNNKDYLDQLYFALGNTFLTNADTTKAIENYKLSVNSSTRNGIDKAITLITMGDLYYLKQNYVDAQPCYEAASKIITNENNDYGRVSRRAELLGELVVQHNIVTLQDSLQHLATLSESKRLDIVNNIINKLIEEEKIAEEKALKETEIVQNGNDEDFAELPPIGSMNAMGGWYFYNPELMRTGQSEFNKKWGRRKLEDNWRRMNKSSSLFSEELAPVATQEINDTTATKQKAAVSDVKDPEFYLLQIPTTPAQLKKSNSEIATALFEEGLIYKDKIEDLPMAIKTFDEFIKRFGSDERAADAYFYNYLIYSKLNNSNEADNYRTKIITLFPDSKYKMILSQPDYAQRMEKMYQEQDSIYNLTYTAYNSSDFPTVFSYVSYIQKNYPLSTLMPKFLFLNALSIGKKETADKFKTALENLVSAHPESDVSAMSKDILALMNQGLEAKPGKTSGTLLVRRDEETIAGSQEFTPQKFSADKKTKHRLMLISSGNANDLNKLLYNIASYNFSSFLIKDFDLAINKLDSTQNALSVTNFESYDEAQWYVNSINTNEELNALMKGLVSQKIIISEDNFALLRTGLGLDEYLLFTAKNKELKQTEQLVNNKNITKTEISSLTVKPKLTEQKPSKTTETTEKQVAITEKQRLEPVKEKPIEKATEIKKDTLKESKSTQKPINSAPVATPPQPKEVEVPLFKNLFAYRANEAHYIAIYIVSGTFDFVRTKAAIDAYNTQNYSIMNLKVSLETVDKQQVILIGSLTDAQVGKSYLLRFVKEKNIFEGLKGAVYRNLLGSQKNLNTLMQQNALPTYFEFMQEYYLK